MSGFLDAPDYARPLQDHEAKGAARSAPQGDSMTGRVLCLIGGQYGSEGKGVIAAHLANRFDVHVRVGGPNAGHSFSFRRDGEDDPLIWKMQSLPCGWVNPDAILAIGAGAIVDLELLMKEIAETGTSAERVFVDPRAVLIEDFDREGVYRLKESIGATGEGVGPARTRRIMRGQQPVRTVGDVVLRNALSLRGAIGPEDGEWPFQVADTVELLDQARARGASILLEGTQGSGLSLIHGAYPFVTSADTGAAQLLADCGVAPAQTESLLVVRTFPIRVGGNSGPMKNETTWDAVSKIARRPVREFTTVTGRERRVAEWDERLVRKAIQLNRPTSVALMFLDYLFPEDEGCSAWEALSAGAQTFVRSLQDDLSTFVQFVGTGGPSFSVVEREP